VGRAGRARRRIAAIPRAARCVALGAACVLLATGCSMPAASYRPGGGTVDPCAEKLHDISGRLLLYFAANHRLPVLLDDLPGVGGVSAAVCPVSGRAYVYDREGLQLPGRSGRLIVYDAAPVHGGMRWGIVIGPEGGKGRPLVAKVILIPEPVVQKALAGREVQYRVR